MERGKVDTGPKKRGSHTEQISTKADNYGTPEGPKSAVLARSKSLLTCQSSRIVRANRSGFDHYYPLTRCDDTLALSRLSGLGQFHSKVVLDKFSGLLTELCMPFIL